MKNIVLLIITSFFFVNFNSGYCQLPHNSFILNKKQARKNKITEIRDLTNINQNIIIDSSTYRLFIFEKGSVNIEAVVSNNVFGSYQGAIINGYHYSYTDSSYDTLIEKIGNADAGIGNQQYFTEYKYLNKHLELVIDGYHYTYRDDSNDLLGGINLTDMTKYIYSLDGKLSHKINYEIDENGQIALSYSINSQIKDSILKECMIIHDTDSDLTLSSLGAIEISRIYFLYDDDKLIGYYPAKDYRKVSLRLNTSDTIYNADKVTEIKKIKTKEFGKKYFTEKIFKSVLADCYMPVKNNELLINRRPVKEFLSGIGKGNTHYLILEIADNYFLFYKIID